MKRALFVAVLTPLMLTIPATAAMADPATNVSPAACNQGTDRARDTANQDHSNVPEEPHGAHTECHVHTP